MTSRTRSFPSLMVATASVVAIVALGIFAHPPPAHAMSGKIAKRIGDAADIFHAPTMSAFKILTMNQTDLFALTNDGAMIGIMTTADAFDLSKQSVGDIYAYDGDKQIETPPIMSIFDLRAAIRPGPVGIAKTLTYMLNSTTSMTDYDHFWMMGELTPTVGGPSAVDDISGATAIAAADTPVGTTHAPPVHLRI